MKYKQLWQVAEYVNERIATSEVEIDDYISTENMLSEKGGIARATTMPDLKTLPKYAKYDILLSNIRPYFKKIWLADRMGGCSNDVLVITAKGIQPKFLYYVLSDNNFFNYSTVTSKGTKMPRGSKPAIMKYLVPDVDNSVQSRIADMLSAYDDAIENNNQRIVLLEKAAQELYKEWFVRFRFPGHENTKFINGLPEGWQRKKMAGNVSFVTGRLNSNDLTPDGPYSFYTCAKTIFKTDTFCFSGECVLLGGNNATGDFSLFYANEKLNAYQRTYIVTPISEQLSSPYIYFVLASYLQSFKSASTGAATKFLTKRILDNLYIVLPRKEIADEYHRISKAFFDEMVVLKSCSENLVRQRDLLLPRLMSGKLEV